MLTNLRQCNRSKKTSKIHRYRANNRLRKNGLIFVHRIDTCFDLWNQLIMVSSKTINNRFESDGMIKTLNQKFFRLIYKKKFWNKLVIENKFWMCYSESPKVNSRWCPYGFLLCCASSLEKLVESDVVLHQTVPGSLSLRVELFHPTALRGRSSGLPKSEKKLLKLIAFKILCN